MTYFKLYETEMSSNGTRGLIITDFYNQIVGCVEECLFGNCPSKDFGWSGDALGNIDAVFYNETVGFVSYDDELKEQIESGELSDFYQVVEVSYQDVREHLAVSPINSALDKMREVHSVLRQIKGVK